MTWQIIGYYLIALLFIPLGYGHLKVRRWTRSLMVALIWCWLVLGVPLLMVFAAILFSTKELSPVFGLVVLALLILSYLLLPWLFLRFYKGSNVRSIFEAWDPSIYWIENLPTPVLVLGILFVIYAIVLHVPIFFNGLYPIFGTWLTGFRGILALDITILFLALLTWGIFNRKGWVWWGGVFFICVFTLSLIFTLWNTSYQELLTLMNFHTAELEFLSELPVQGIHFAAFVSLPSGFLNKKVDTHKNITHKAVVFINFRRLAFPESF